MNVSCIPMTLNISTVFDNIKKCIKENIMYFKEANTNNKLNFFLKVSSLVISKSSAFCKVIQYIFITKSITATL